MTESIVAVCVLAAAVVVLAILLLRKPAQSGQMQLMQQQIDALREQLSQSFTGLSGNVTTQMSTASEQASQRLQGMVKQMGQLSESLNRQIADINKNVSERIDKQTGVFGDVKEKVGALEESKKLLANLREEISGLRNIFAAPKLRGEFGEESLEELLADRLPSGKYALQYELGSERVDAAVLLDDGIIPIDAKFPLDNFRRMAACDDRDSAEAKRARSDFAQNVKKHINDISSKYIRPDKKTLDFALMYIPAENVYHHLLLQNDLTISGQTIMQYAAAKNVIAVSPNSLFAYLQTIVMGLRRMQIEEHAHEVLQNQKKWGKQIGRFSDDFATLGKHLRNAWNKYEDSARWLDKLISQFETLGGLEAGEIEGDTQKPLDSARDKPLHEGRDKPLPPGPEFPTDAAG
jgi:DNA recombination protein RmuC